MGSQRRILHSHSKSKGQGSIWIASLHLGNKIKISKDSHQIVGKGRSNYGKQKKIRSAHEDGAVESGKREHPIYKRRYKL